MLRQCLNIYEWKHTGSKQCKCKRMLNYFKNETLTHHCWMKQNAQITIIFTIYQSDLDKKNRNVLYLFSSVIKHYENKINLAKHN